MTAIQNLQQKTPPDATSYGAITHLRVMKYLRSYVKTAYCLFEYNALVGNVFTINFSIIVLGFAMIEPVQLGLCVFCSCWAYYPMFNFAFLSWFTLMLCGYASTQE